MLWTKVTKLSQPLRSCRSFAQEEWSASEIPISITLLPGRMTTAWGIQTARFDPWHSMTFWGNAFRGNPMNLGIFASPDTTYNTNQETTHSKTLQDSPLRSCWSDRTSAVRNRPLRKKWSPKEQTSASISEQTGMYMTLFHCSGNRT